MIHAFALIGPPLPTTIFRMNAAGERTVLHEFQSLQPQAIVQSTDGRIYGISVVRTPRAGTIGGSVFRVNLPRTWYPISVIAMPGGRAGVTLRWNAVAGVRSYTLTRFLPGQAPTIAASGLTTTTFTVPLEVAGADASYVVTAVDATGEPLASAPRHVPWVLRDRGHRPSPRRAIMTATARPTSPSIAAAAPNGSHRGRATPRSRASDGARRRCSIARCPPTTTAMAAPTSPSIVRPPASGSSRARPTARSAAWAGARPRSMICRFRPTTTATAGPISPFTAARPASGSSTSPRPAHSTI
jgi:hypothetical protein